MKPVPPRSARLVLLTPGSELLGCLPPLSADSPWWPETRSILDVVRERYGLEVTILRLLEAESPQPPGGSVTYLAELSEPVPAGFIPVERWEGVLEEHPLRHPWARPGGPAMDLAWAGSILAEQGLRLVGRPEQMRTWNLSSLWRIPVEGQTLWLKVVPQFFAHEGAILERFQGGPLPRLLAHHGGRSLLAEVPGDDRYEASGTELLDMVRLLVESQREWRGRVDELLGLGLPDWRSARLTEAIGDVVERTAGQLDEDDRTTLAAFVDGLPARLEAVGDCGVGDTLVHGDFHPGNFRGDGQMLTLLDWSDSGVGHPLLDQPAFLQVVAPHEVEPVKHHWHRLWAEAVPGSDAPRAARLLAPVAAARQAVIYRLFLDHIEPSEHIYHRSDPVDWLLRTAGLVHESSSS
ncbi:MAG: aminoglycoside phosphotransferase family protein [Chloroflexi bacterium]|nr:aminoglycoside phosphotransferase family protein [Chloroflexota bacterium]